MLKFGVSTTLTLSLISACPEITISEAGIFSLLNRLKISTASDHVGFNNKILNLSASICPILRALFSQFLSSGCIPHDWRIPILILIKSGERSSPLNYRPISLTNHFCKLLERICTHKLITTCRIITLYINTNTVFAEDALAIHSSPVLFMTSIHLLTVDP